MGERIVDAILLTNKIMDMCLRHEESIKTFLVVFQALGNILDFFDPAVRRHCDVTR